MIEIEGMMNKGEKSEKMRVERESVHEAFEAKGE
jgi:hypothetical protein